jgi:hypothetical protein
MGSLNVFDFAGASIYVEDGPPFPPGAPTWLQGFDACSFDESGDYLWCSRYRSVSEIEIQLRETRGWSIIDESVVPDPWHATGCSFYPSGRKDLLIALWLAAGEEGQQVYWLWEDDGKIALRKEPQLRNTIPPVFSPTGAVFWVVDDDARVSRFEYGPMTRTCSFHSPCDDTFDHTLACLDEQRAIAGTNNSRIFLVDAMRAEVEEVIVAGHEPQPLGRYYKELTEEEGLCTDISDLSRLGDTLVMATLSDELLCFETHSILDGSYV